MKERKGGNSRNRVWKRIVGRENGREQLEVRLGSVKLKLRMHGRARRVDKIDILM